jgi:hypothetical protein
MNQSYTIYHVNNIPHICFAHQPDILYPVYFQEPQSVPTYQYDQYYENYQPQQRNVRILPEIVSGVGGVVDQVVEQQFNTLGVYANNLEQNVINTVNEKVKTSCCGLRSLSKK